MDVQPCSYTNHPDANLAIYSPAVLPLSQQAYASTSYASLSKDQPVAQTMAGNLCKGKSRLKQKNSILKKRVAVQKVWCELCKVECPDVQLYAKHISGKLHNKNLRKLYAPAVQASQSINKTSTSAEQALPGLTHVPLDLESKRQKLLESGAAVQSLRVCTICNVACNSEVAYADHLAGKKHIAQERASLNPVDAHIRTESQEIAAKKTVNIGCVQCEVCKISCTSNDGLTVHKQGKRHKKNVEKLQNSTQPCRSLENAESQQMMHTGSWCEICKISCTSNDGLTIHNQGKKHKKNVGKLQIQTLPCKDPPNVESEQQQQQQQYVESQQVMGIIGVQPKESDDVETNKRKILEIGTAENAVRTCSLCNVVCNSDIVFKFHLAGSKHRRMMKQVEGKMAA